MRGLWEAWGWRERGRREALWATLSTGSGVCGRSPQTRGPDPTMEGPSSRGPRPGILACPRGRARPRVAGHCARQSQALPMAGWVCSSGHSRRACRGPEGAAGMTLPSFF